MSFRREQALNKLHTVKGNFGAKGPQAGSLTMLIVYLQTLANKPANTSTNTMDIYLHILNHKLSQQKANIKHLEG